MTLLNSDRQLRVKETHYNDEKEYVQKILEDGTTVMTYKNGTTKEISADKKKVYVKFFNNDRKEVDNEANIETYYYAETNITQIKYQDEYQIIKFPNGQVEKYYKDKTREVIFPDNTCKIYYPDGREESRLANGTRVILEPNGNKIMEYPNGQREIHTGQFKRREYPDGSIKTVYTNGISETVYANGRVRVKDSSGNIISDNRV